MWSSTDLMEQFAESRIVKFVCTIFVLNSDVHGDRCQRYGSNTFRA